MTNIRVRLTKSDIIRGRRCDISDCPIARASQRRRFVSIAVKVTNHEIRVYANGYEAHSLKPRARYMIGRFDQRNRRTLRRHRMTPGSIITTH